MSTAKTAGDAVSHHRSLCQFMCQLILKVLWQFLKGSTPARHLHFWFHNKHNIKTITVLGIKDVLVSKDSEQKCKTKGEEKGNETV